MEIKIVVKIELDEETKKFLQTIFREKMKTEEVEAAQEQSKKSIRSPK